MQDAPKVSFHARRAASCSSGLTDADRRYFKKQIDNQVPMIVRVVAQEETEDGSLRFPSFVAERKDL